MLGDRLTGSHLTRAMLTRGDKQVWCAVTDDSDEEAIKDLVGNDFTALIASFNEDSFFCTSGMQWSFAVPIKVVTVIEDLYN